LLGKLLAEDSEAGRTLAGARSRSWLGQVGLVTKSRSMGRCLLKIGPLSFLADRDDTHPVLPRTPCGAEHQQALCESDQAIHRPRPTSGPLPPPPDEGDVHI
ncbi:unnamed protein product, partial [Closterium sp. Naga37s-1]